MSDQNISYDCTVLFGSMTGNAEDCAKLAGERLKGAGLQVRVVSMDDYSADKLKNEKNILMVVSTWGDGEPPDSASDFI